MVATVKYGPIIVEAMDESGLRDVIKTGRTMSSIRIAKRAINLAKLNVLPVVAIGVSPVRLVMAPVKFVIFCK